ncbi:hypothetical protein HMPREF9073_01090 [Capnocytophaga sp. oral taxon 326 str. F0382]|nr:hypothetical protein HMPREF9073_01090 [Capnocytophaga sp. oral taxon 326 str. F0382]
MFFEYFHKIKTLHLLVFSLLIFGKLFLSFQRPKSIAKKHQYFIGY